LHCKKQTFQNFNWIPLYGNVTANCLLINNGWLMRKWRTRNPLQNHLFFCTELFPCLQLCFIFDSFKFKKFHHSVTVKLFADYEIKRVAREAKEADIR
jgi:hypothetical protein